MGQLSSPLLNRGIKNNQSRRRGASNGLVLILLLGLVVGVVFVCGLYVGSAFMHEHSHTESDHRSAFYVFVENPKLRGAVRSFEGLFDGHRQTPPPANPHGKAESVVGPGPPSAPLPKPPAPAEPAAPGAPAPDSQPAAAAAAAGAAAAEGSASSSQDVPLPSGKNADAVPSLQTDADRGAKLKSPYDSPSVTVSAWIYLPSDKSTRTMNTILANKASGCETSGERMGYALYVNTWETADRQLILEWGNSQSGCAKLGSGQGASLIEYDTWTHVAAVLEPTSAAIYINGKQAAKSSPIERKVQESAPLKLGRNGDETYPFIGRIASVAIFTDALSESQIQEVSTKPLSDPLFKGSNVALALPLSDAPNRAKDGTKVKDTSGKVVGGYLLPFESGSMESLLDGVPESALTEVTPEMRADSDALARERTPQIRAAMQRVWKAYREHAWGFDELKPISLRGQNNWGGIGCTLVDSLDTLWLMGLKDEFFEARDWVRDKLTFANTGSVSVFETTIRELGGLLSAYDLSGDKAFVKAAEDLADRLLPAFDTPTGIPMNQANLQSKNAGNAGWTGGSSVLAELGTLQVEFRYLSHVTGKNIYAEKVNRVFDLMAEKHPPNGLYPIYISSQNGEFQSNQITFGALGDSFYEYMLKVWLQGGRTEPAYRRMFDEAMDGVINKLLKKSSPSGLLYVSDLEGGHNVHKMDHLACFLPAVLALGAKTLPTEDQERHDKYMAAAQGLTHTCYQMYHRYPTHLAPEYVRFQAGQDMVPGANFYILRPEAAEALFYLHELTGHPIYREWAWEIFQGIDRYCRTAEAYGAHPDVTNPGRTPDDRMESFFLAETMKYLYLIQDPDQPIDLFKYVFNTEAHPMKVWGKPYRHHMQEAVQPGDEQAASPSR